MGCYSSRDIVEPCNHRHSLYHRFSHCNGRITRIIQDDHVDVCEDETCIFDLTANVKFNDDIEFSNKLEVRGFWVCGVSAGGSRNNIELFATNPQYELEIQYLHESKISVRISLEQKNFQTKPSHIAFFVYMNENPGNSLSAEYFLCVAPLFSSGSFKKREIISATIYLKPTTYVVIPAIFHAHHDDEFVIRIETTAKANVTLKELTIVAEPVVYYKHR